MVDATRVELTAEDGASAAINAHRGVVDRLGEAYEKFERDLQRFNATGTQSSAVHDRLNDMSLNTARNLVQMAAAYVSAATGIDTFIASVNRMDQIGELSEKLALNTQLLQENAYAGKMTGVELNTLVDGHKKLQLSMAAAATGSKEELALFKAMGVEVRDVNGQVRASESVMMDFADVMSSLEDGAIKTSLASKVLGKSAGPEMVAYLSMGSEGIRQLTEEAHALGAVMGDNLIDEAGRFNDQVDRLTTVMQASVNQITSEMIPAISDLIERFIQGKKAGMGFWEAVGNALSVTIDRAMGESYGEQIRDINREIELLRNSKNPFSLFGGESLDEDVADLERAKKVLLEMQSIVALAGSGEGDWDWIDRRFSDKSEKARAGAGIMLALKKAQEQEAAARAYTKELEEQARVIAELNGITGSFSEQWNRLNAIYARGKISVEELTKAQADLLAKQPAIKKAMDTEARAAQVLADEWEEAAKAKAAYDKEYGEKWNRGLQMVNEYSRSIDESNRLMEFELGLMGQGESARNIAIGQYNVRLKLEQEILRIEQLGLDAADKRLLIEKAMIAAEKANAGVAARINFDAWNRTAEDIERSLNDAIIRGLEDGFDGAEDVVDTFLRSVRNQFLTASLKLPIQFVSGTISSFMNMGAPQAAAYLGGGNSTLGALGQGYSLYSSGQSMLSALNGGIAASANTASQVYQYGANLLSGATGSVSTGAAGTGWVSAEGGAGYLSSGASAAGTVSSYLGYGGLGIMAGQAISNGYGSNATVYGGALGGAAVGAQIGSIGGPLGMMIGAIIGGALNRAFGRKAVGSGIIGSIDGDDFSGDSYVFKRGGWARSDKTVKTGLDNQTDDAFDMAIEGLYDGFTSLSETIGVDADLLKDYSYSFRLALADFSDEERPKVIQTHLARISDSMASTFVDSFRTSIDLAAQQANSYYTNTKDGERDRPSGASGILSQDRTASQLDPYIDDIIRLFDAQRESLKGVQDAEGQLAAFTNQIFNFGDALAENEGYLKVFREALDFDKLEEAAARGESVFDTFDRLNAIFAVTNSIARSLGQNIDTMFGAAGLASTEARQRVIDRTGGIDALSAGAASFAENFLTEAERMAPIIQDVTEHMAELGYASVDTKDEFKALMLDLASSGRIATEEGADLYAQLLQLGPAFATVADYSQRLADEAIDKARKDAEDRERIDRLLSEPRNILADAYKRESQAMRDTINRHDAYVKSHRALRDALTVGEFSNLSPYARYAELSRQFEDVVARRNAGDESALAEFDVVAREFLEASQEFNASGAGYTNDLSRVLAETERGVQVSEKQVDLARTELAKLDALVEPLLTINQSVVSVEQAIVELSQKMATFGVAAPSGAATSINQSMDGLIESLYVDVLGRASDAEGKTFWVNALQSGVSYDSIRSQFYTSPEYLSLHGSHASGLDYVPFDGYRAELHEGEAVLTASKAKEYREGTGNKEVTAAIRDQTAVIAQTHELLQRLITAVDTSKSASSEDIRSLKQHLAHVMKSTVSA